MINIIDLVKNREGLEKLNSEVVRILSDSVYRNSLEISEKINDPYSFYALKIIKNAIKQAEYNKKLDIK